MDERITGLRSLICLAQQWAKFVDDSEPAIEALRKILDAVDKIQLEEELCKHTNQKN